MDSARLKSSSGLECGSKSPKPLQSWRFEGNVPHSSPDPLKGGTWVEMDVAQESGKAGWTSNGIYTQVLTP